MSIFLLQWSPLITHLTWLQMGQLLITGGSTIDTDSKQIQGFFFCQIYLLQYFIQKQKMRHLEWIYRTCSWRREHISDRWLPPPATKCASWSESCSAAIIPTSVPYTGKNTIWQLLAANKSNEIIRLSLITLLHIQEQLICLSNQFHTAKYHWVLAVKAMLSWGVPYVENRNCVKILIWKSHETVCCVEKKQQQKQNESFKQSETVEKITNFTNRAAPLAVFSLICHYISIGLWPRKKKRFRLRKDSGIWMVLLAYYLFFFLCPFNQSEHFFVPENHWLD